MNSEFLKKKKKQTLEKDVRALGEKAVDDSERNLCRHVVDEESKEPRKN
jgi:hypothetical protein